MSIYQNISGSLQGEEKGQLRILAYVCGLVHVMLRMTNYLLIWYWWSKLTRRYWYVLILCVHYQLADTIKRLKVTPTLRLISSWSTTILFHKPGFLSLSAFGSLLGAAYLKAWEPCESQTHRRCSRPKAFTFALRFQQSQPKDGRCPFHQWPCYALWSMSHQMVPK